ncbi:hypothetical protein FDP41_001575 [Naegleria fowleri]|uniref:Uncharacterized protein n=1 Tax=Naegleria fowleri TaxID=5763 RepID=A0A6A5BX59_NAEFO|nr:uncharacterized protein FDP41_001575 [Naegleria fowleri]KAF0979232.1 hypothetical protein FDP41_001575 [Naegleria fowleri]CAG4715632.1 unnamed protein product [Naegleria fowleri]
MKKQNPFVHKKVNSTSGGGKKVIIGSFVNEDDHQSASSPSGATITNKTTASSKRSNSSSTREDHKRKIETTGSEHQQTPFTSYPLSKKKKDSEQQPNVGRITESMMRASMVKPESDSTSLSKTTETYIKPLPANFFDSAPSEYDQKKIQEGYKDLTKSGKSSGVGAETIIKDKGFAMIVNSAVIKKKIDKSTTDKSSSAHRQTKAERNLEALEQELDEREDAEEMKRQLEEFLKIEEIRKQTEALMSSSKSTTKKDLNNKENSETMDANDSKTTKEQDESDDELEMNWKSKSLKKK